MSKLDIHGCVNCVRGHFYEADHLQLEYTLPVEAYSLNRILQHRICSVWNRFEAAKSRLTERECILLAEAWAISAPDFTKLMFVDGVWTPNCVHCGCRVMSHNDHPDNNPAGNPPDRWLCEDGSPYEPIKYKLPQSGKHPSDIEVNRKQRHPSDRSES